jgi:murein DD-endopeptidase MepM/ murein hydrolase activator NlpD
MEVLIIAGLFFLLMNTPKGNTESNTGTGTGSKPEYIWPVKTPVRITSRFGEKRGTSYHNGLDVAVPVGTSVFAIADGIVDSIWNDTAGGLSMRIKHDQGITVGYAHLSKNNLLSVGDKVKQGQIVALSGNTGNSTGPHLHITVRINGTVTNPENILPK